MTTDERIASVEARLAAIEVRLAARPPTPQPAPSAPSGTVADDRDLEGPHGDPEVRIPAADKWTPWREYHGRRMSACPPELLDKLAGLYDWMAGKDDEAGQRGEMYRDRPKDGKWKRLDASRCRGWAARIRAQQAAAPADPGTGDGIPF